MSTTTKKIKRIAQIWEELEPLIGGTGASDLITELIELELEIEQECNK